MKNEIEVKEKDNTDLYSLIDADIEKTFTYEQRIEIKRALSKAKWLKRKFPAKKIIDYRFSFKLIKKYYMVFFFGEDQRNAARDNSQVAFFTKYFLLSAIMACVVIVLMVLLLLALYIVKSVSRIDLFKDFHLSDLIIDFKNIFS